MYCNYIAYRNITEDSFFLEDDTTHVNADVRICTRCTVLFVAFCLSKDKMNVYNICCKCFYCSVDSVSVSLRGEQAETRHI